MKEIKRKIVLLALFLIPILGNCQKIAENYTDDFTKKNILRTEWEKISTNSDLWLNVRISKINETSYLELKFISKAVSSIDTNDDLMFMLENGEIITLKSDKYKLANYGDGAIGLVGSKALGFSIDCLLNESNIENFKSNFVKKIRFNTSKGYLESELKSKNSEKLKDLFLLVYK